MNSQPVWKGKGGKQIFICDMPYGYLDNAIKLLERKADKRYSEELTARYGTMRAFYEESFNVADYYPVYDLLVDERIRRHDGRQQ